MRLFIISNRLPVKVTRSSDGKFVFSRSEGGLATGLKSLDVDCEKHWIGWPGVCVEQKTEKDDICSQLEKNNYHPELAYKTVEWKLREKGIIVGKDVQLCALKRTTPSDLYEFE